MSLFQKVKVKQESESVASRFASVETLERAKCNTRKVRNNEKGTEAIKALIWREQTNQAQRSVGTPWHQRSEFITYTRLIFFQKSNRGLLSPSEPSSARWMVNEADARG